MDGSLPGQGEARSRSDGEDMGAGLLKQGGWVQAEIPHQEGDIETHKEGTMALVNEAVLLK